MKKSLCRIFFTICVFSALLIYPSAASSSVSSPATLTVPSVVSQTAILVDADSGAVLYAKNMHQRMYPASITKILTGVVVVKNGEPNDTITVDSQTTNQIHRGDASIALQDGETLTQEQALYAMFLASANDAALALSLHTGGTIPNFVGMMNAQAKVCGAVDSHFNNPDGLPDVNNYTSAYDMAAITKYALEMPELMKYFSARAYTIRPTNKQPESRPLYTLQKMMRRSRYYYPAVFAGKTGWETMSGYTLVTAARENGITLICVTMKSSSAAGAYNDTKNLLDYGFQSGKSLTPLAYVVAPQQSNLAAKAASIPAVVKTEKAVPPFSTKGKFFRYLVVTATLFTAVLFAVFLLGKRRIKKQHRSEPI